MTRISEGMTKWTVESGEFAGRVGPPRRHPARAKGQLQLLLRLTDGILRPLPIGDVHERTHIARRLFDPIIAPFEHRLAVGCHPAHVARRAHDPIFVRRAVANGGVERPGRLG